MYLPFMLALAGGTIYTNPAEHPLRGGVVLIDGAAIAAVGTHLTIPAGTEVIDCSGRVVTAGFWNCHVHFAERKWADTANTPASELAQQLEDMLTRYGFTSAFDLSSPWANTRALRERAGVRILSTGPGLLPRNPAIPESAVQFMGWMKMESQEVSTPAEAAAAARQLLDDGVDGIKLFASAPSKASLDEATMRAAVDEAHQRGKPVFVHPNSGRDVMTAVRAGADVIAHTTPHSGPWDHELLAAMRDGGVALTPTLSLWKWYARHDRRSAQDAIVATELAQLRAWLQRGGTVLFGTDLGAVDPDPREEYELMAQAGMSFAQILESLTTMPAERFATTTGRVAAGFEADLVVLGRDFADVQYTIRRGKIVFRR
jgi:imidazolonepropionase-like amidohydrolase